MVAGRARLTDEAETAEEKKWHEERRKFYALVGHCILRFQHVEDYLEDVFAAVLGGSRSRADAIFASVRGVDRKLQIIKAAATGRDGQPWDRLVPMLDAVKDVSGVRGQIAHANPVQKGLFRIRVKTEDGHIVETLGVDHENRWELHKQATKERIVFSPEDLLREYKRIDDLFGEMVTFVKDATNAAV
jgi:hypothetical protein